MLSSASSSPDRPVTGTPSGSLGMPASVTSEEPLHPNMEEPFFAVKVGTFSWFCTWGDTPVLASDGRGRYETASQNSRNPTPSSSFREETPAAGADVGGPSTRIRPMGGIVARGGGSMRKVRWHAGQILQLQGGFHLDALERKRRSVLRLATILSEVSLLLAAIGFFGGLLGGEVTRYFNWMSIPRAGRDAYMGLQHICAPPPHTNDTVVPPMTCTHFYDFNCSTMLSIHELSCKRCKNEALNMIIPMLIATVTTGRLVYASMMRRKDKQGESWDTSWNKAMTVGGAIMGSLATFFNLMFFRFSCGRLSEDLHPSAHGQRCWGPGFQLMALATILKLLCGILHFGLVAKADTGLTDQPQGILTPVDA